MPELTALQIRRLFELGPERAIAYLESLGIEVTWDWQEQLEAIKRQAFTISRVASADAIQTVRDELVRASKSGVSWRDWQEKTGDLLKQKGYRTKDDGSAWRLDTIFRTNMQSAYHAGRYQQMSSTSDRFPYWEYRAVGDKRTRPSHKELDGLILPKDHPFWRKVFPPNGYRCFPPGTEVATPHGWKPIEGIRSGDSVLGGSGHVQPVITQFTRHFDGELVRVVAAGEEFSATDNHRVLTLRGWIEAGSLEVGDILVQSPEAAGLDVPVHDVDESNTGLRDIGVTSPRHRSTIPEAFNSDSDLREENVNPVDADMRIVLDDVSVTSQLVNHHLLVPSRVGLGRWMSSGVLSVADLLCYTHLTPDLWSTSRRGLSKAFCRLRNRLARLLGYPESRVTPFSAHFCLDLAKPLAGSAAALIGINPLSLHRLASVTDRDAEMAKQAHNRSVVHTPSALQKPDTSLLLDVESLQGVDDAAPLAFFDSIDGFRAWARLHGVLRKVDSVTRASYVGVIYNLEVESDQSYSLRTGIVHNCRCSVTALTERQARARGYRPPRDSQAESSTGEVDLERWVPDEGFVGIPGQPLDPDLEKYNPTLRRQMAIDLGGG